jgi:transposase
MDEADVLPLFQGRAIHGFWKPYFDYDCQHAICNAHLLRELDFLHEQQNRAWAKGMIHHLLAAKAAVATARSADLQGLPDTQKVFFSFQGVHSSWRGAVISPPQGTTSRRRS